MPLPTPAEIISRYGAQIGLDEQRIEDLTQEFAEIARKYTGAAIEPQTVTETLHARHHRTQLSNYPVTAITAVTIDDDPVDVAMISFDSAGMLYLPADGTVEVTYTHGEDTPEVARRACVEYIRAVALSERSGTSRDVISQSFDGGFTRYSTPNWEQGRPTGFLEVDRLLASLPNRHIPGIG